MLAAGPALLAFTPSLHCALHLPLPLLYCAKHHQSPLTPSHKLCVSTLVNGRDSLVSTAVVFATLYTIQIAMNTYGAEVSD